MDPDIKTLGWFLLFIVGGFGLILCFQLSEAKRDIEYKVASYGQAILGKLREMEKRQNENNPK